MDFDSGKTSGGMNEESLGRIVEMRTAQGEYHGVGKVVGYQEQPTYKILTPTGKLVSWAAHLCQEPGLSKQAGDELLPSSGPQPGK